jgi:hypothetical protein
MQRKPYTVQPFSATFKTEANVKQRKKTRSPPPETKVPEKNRESSALQKRKSSVLGLRFLRYRILWDSGLINATALLVLLLAVAVSLLLLRLGCCCCCCRHVADRSPRA